MKKMILCGAVSVTALMGTHLQAQEANGNWYAGLDGYVSFLDNERASRGNLDVVNDYKTGGGFAGILGYDFGTLRMELEAGTHYHTPDQLIVTTDTALGLTTGPATAGKAKAIHYMFNAVVDLDEFMGNLDVNPFVGGGLGVSSVKLRNITGTGAPAYVNSADDVITYQAFAGIRKAVSDNVDLSLKYRYMHGNDSDMVDRLGQIFNYTHDLHDIVFGITYNFGKKRNDEMAKRPRAAMPAPVAAVEPAPEPIPDVSPAAGAPTPAPTPAPPPAVDRGPFAIYFDWDSSFISTEARDVIRKVIVESGKLDQIRLQVDGHADRSGPTGYNDNLSFERATAVKEFMIANGVDANKIIIEGHGERNPEITTDDGIRERRNRRVTINLN